MSLTELAAIALDDPERAPRAGKPVFVAAHPDSLALEPALIEPSWVISGDPRARARLHSASADGFASTTIWDCTEGAFRWRFDWDETVVILDGSVRVTDAAGGVTELAAGDVAFFAAGSWATWEVGAYVRKVAFCRRVFPRPVVAAIAFKGWLKSLIGRREAGGAGLGARPAPVTARG